MNTNELSNEIRRTIWERQNGMCALTGKKFEDFNELSDAIFIAVHPVENIENFDGNSNNAIMIWKQHGKLPKGRLRKYLFPYANFNEYEVENKAQEIKEEIDTIISLANTSTDWKEIRGQIRDITNILQTLGLSIQQRSEYKELLLTALNSVNQRQNEENEQNKVVWNSNYDELKQKTIEAIEFAKNTEIFKDAREKLIAVQNEYKKLKVRQEHRRELEKMMHDAFEELKSKQQNYLENFEMECMENYLNIKNIVDDAVQQALTAEAFVEARDLLIEAQNQIKDKTLKREQRNEFFGVIRKTFDELREKFVEYQKINDEEANANYIQIKPGIDADIEFAKNATAEQINDAREKLIEAQNLIKATRLHKGQKDELFAAIREVFEKVNVIILEEKKQFDEETTQNFNAILSKIEVVVVDIENALDFRNSADDLVSISTELKLAKLKRKQREKLFDKIRTAFALLAQKRNEYNKRAATEKQSKLEDTCNNLQQKIERISELLENDKRILLNQKEKIERMDDSSEQAKNNTMQIIEAVEQRIKERETIIATTKKRIEDIKKEIDKIVNTIEKETNSNRKPKRKKRKKDTDTTEDEQDVEAAEPNVEVAAEPNVEVAAEPNVEVAAEPNVEVAAEQNTEVAAEQNVEVAAEQNTEVATEQNTEGETTNEAIN